MPGPAAALELTASDVRQLSAWVRAGTTPQRLAPRLAAAARPGGTLLIVGHHPSDLETTVGRPNLPDLFSPPKRSRPLFTQTTGRSSSPAPERQTLDPDGQPVTIRDAVMRAIRRE